MGIFIAARSPAALCMKLLLCSSGLPGSEEDSAFSAKLNPTDAELLEISFPQENFKVVVSDFSPSSAN